MDTGVAADDSKALKDRRLGMDLLGRSKLQIVALVRSPELGRDLVAAVGAQNGTRVAVQVGELKVLGAKLASEGNPDVLIVDLDPDDPEEMAALQELTRPGAGAALPVVATAASISPVMLRRLLRDGIDDFIPQPVTAPEVLDALRTALRKHEHVVRRPRRVHGSVVTFMRASGGMGATTLAINAAYMLAQSVDGAAPRVCVLDLDPQFGNAALYLDLAYGRGIVDIIRSPSRLDGDMLRSAMLQHRSGIHVLTAPGIPMPLEALRPEVIEQIIDVAEREFDYVIIDLPHALTTWTEVVLVRSAAIKLVAQMTVPALRQARRMLDMLQEEGHYALPLAIALNRYTRKWNDLLGLKDVEKALGRKVDHVVANDFEVVSGAINQGLPAVAISRRSKFCHHVEEMAAATIAGLQTERPAIISN